MSSASNNSHLDSHRPITVAVDVGISDEDQTMWDAVGDIDPSLWDSFSMQDGPAPTTSMTSPASEEVANASLTEADDVVMQTAGAQGAGSAGSRDLLALSASTAPAPSESQVDPASQLRRGRGRPKTSKNNTPDALESIEKRGPGRPKGSGPKQQAHAADPNDAPALPKRRPGRPRKDPPPVDTSLLISSLHLSGSASASTPSGALAPVFQSHDQSASSTNAQSSPGLSTPDPPPTATTEHSHRICTELDPLRPIDGNLSLNEIIDDGLGEVLEKRTRT